MAKKQSLAALIDHTLLKPEATHDQIRVLCEEAVHHGFATVCVRLANVEYCASLLQGSPVKVCSVVGFPTGTELTAAKVDEAREAIDLGAREIDMVVNVPKLKRGQLRAVYLDLRRVIKACGAVPVKVILETSLLTKEEKLIGAALAKAAGAAFLKTSTGFAGGGATVEDVRLLRRVAGRKVGVKASGGVKNRADAEAMIAAGANRIGTSSGLAIVGNSPSQSGQSGVY